MSEYYECHITMQGNNKELKSFLANYGWKYSAIAGDPVLGGNLYYYATKHFASIDSEQDVVDKTKAMSEILRKSDYDVVRHKVEYIVFDSRWKDVRI